MDPDDTLFVAQMDFGRIGRIEGDGSITTIAGRAGSADDFLRPMPAASAQFYSPIGVAVDAKGSAYIADSSIHRVRVISPAGIITTVAGTGSAGYSGDGGLATQSSLYLPSGVAVDTRGNVYIADHGNRRIGRYLQRVPSRQSPARGRTSLSATCGQSRQTAPITFTLRTPAVSRSEGFPPMGPLPSWPATARRVIQETEARRQTQTSSWDKRRLWRPTDKATCTL